MSTARYNNSHGGGTKEDTCGDNCKHNDYTSVSLDEQSVQKDIFYAANDGDFALLKKFVEEDNVDVNGKGDDDVTCLHWAAFKNHFEMAKYLLEHGANPNVTNKSEGHTPLMWASIAGSLKIVHLLISYNADWQCVDARGYNCIHHAIQYNQAVVAHYLLEKGLFVDARDNEGHTALLWAAYSKHEDSVRYLLSQGADINAQDNGGCSALHWAASKGHVLVVRELLSSGKANPHLRDKENLTPAQTAEKKGHVKMAKILRECERIQSRQNGQPQAKMNEKHIQYLWFFVAFVGVQYVFFVLTTFPDFWMGVLAVVVSMYVVKFLLKNLWLDSSHRNPTWVGVVMSSYALSNYIYFFSIYPITASEFPMETLLFVILNCIFFPLYVKLLNSDPGYVRKRCNPANEWKNYMISLEKGEPLSQFCLTCMVRKPIRGKHCRSCNECVARFDHHCGWLNNCVGTDNHFYFLIELGIVIVNHLLFIHFCLTALGSLHGAPSFYPANKSIPFYFENEPVVVVLVVFHALNVFWQTWLFAQLMNGVKQNVTTNETINGSKYDYLKDPFIPNRYYNPFNRGFVNNLRDIMNPKIDWYHLYTLPRQQSV